MESLVSDIPAWDGKNDNIFYSAPLQWEEQRLPVYITPLLFSLELRETSKICTAYMYSTLGCSFSGKDVYIPQGLQQATFTENTRHKGIP
jgi:hypothetical protein